MTKNWDAVLIFGLLLAVVFTGIAGFGKDCAEVRDSVLRFHVLANSDSDEDQALKLLVRDAVLEETKSLFLAADSLETAEQTARQHLGEIQVTAEKTLRANGSDAAVKASVVNMYFETRTYGEETLPAGYYDAIRIEIGKAEGHNWWCVMFPPLCVGTAADSRELQMIEALGEEPEYKLSFASVEWIEKLLSRIKT